MIFGEILSFCSQNIDQKRNSDINKLCPFVLKILSGKEILTSIKDHNSVTNLRKMTGNTLNIDLVNIDLKFGEILSIYSFKILSGNENLTSINSSMLLI